MHSITTPPVDLTRAPHRYAASGDVVQVAPACSSASTETATLEMEAQREADALQDIVTLAHGIVECRHRVVQMQRRAMTALAGADTVREHATGRG